MSLARSLPRLTASPILLVTLLGLSACGGGGGDSSSPPSTGTTPDPVAVSSTKFAACVQAPAAGTVNFYLNTSRPRREWRNATYAGELLSARYEYASASATQPVQIRYSRVDAAAKTSTLLAQETFDPTTGALTSREQYTGRTFSQALAEGQSETVNYTVRTLLPAGVPDRTERIVRTFEGEVPVTLSQGTVTACEVVESRSSVSGATATRLSIEALYYVPGASFVRSYFIDTNPAVPPAETLRQTALVELDRSTAPLTYVAWPVTSTPTLSACTAIRPNQGFLLSANGATFGSPYENSVRLIRSGTLNGAATMAVTRGNATTAAVSSIRHFDPTVGFLMSVGLEDVVNGAVTGRRVSSGIPDLRTAAIGQPISYTVLTQTLPTTGAPPSSFAETLTFQGHQRIGTYFGNYDTCKVKFDYPNPGTGPRSETYYYAPNLHWLRYEAVLASGERVTREVMEQEPLN